MKPQEPTSRKTSSNLKINWARRSTGAVIAIGGVILAGWFIRSGLRKPEPVSELTTPQTERPLAQENTSEPAPTLTSASQATASPEARLSAVTTEKLNILSEILASRNDNDPRLDTEFRGLSEETKKSFHAKYRSIPAEQRNAKGTVVFLLGREITGPADVAFLREVLSEPPCQSLADCSKPQSVSSGDDLHHESGMEITLAYPQMVALVSLDDFLKSNAAPDPAMRDAIAQALQTARSSGIPVLVRKAAEVEKRLRK